MVPTPTERLRTVFDVIADVAPQRYAPWLCRLLIQSLEDAADGSRPLPWLTPTITHEDNTVDWISSGNKRSIMHNKTLSFCPGAMLDGKPQPFVVGAGEVTSPLCASLTLSIAKPRVFHNAIHTGSVSTKDFGLYTFPKSVFQHMEAAP